MTTDQVVFSEDELLASHDFSEPLVAGGTRCHGGFVNDGTYVSPRTLNRVPAIAAWQDQHARQFGTDLLDLSLDTWPEAYPNVAQGRYLIEVGAPEPIVASLTRIGTVEGFGAAIRNSVLPDFQLAFAEDTRGTAMAHLGGGLYEAHARDEAGFGDEAGHKDMWFAARDIAFEHPVTADETARLLERMGFTAPGGAVIPPARLQAMALANRLLPDDVDFGLEALIERMVRLLLIEIQAFHTFAWAETLLADPDLVAGEGAAAQIVSYIRTDESPHVQYLRTVLSEMRDRTFVGDSGRSHPGTELVGRIWDRALSQSLGERRTDGLGLARREVIHALDGRNDADDVLARFDELGSVRPAPDGTWIDAAA